MGRFTTIPQDTFEALQLDAGMLLSKFDPANPTFEDKDIITATTGGITVAAVPTFSDLGEDVDNVPNNMMEFKHLDSWDMSISTTGLGTNPRLIKLALGCADIDAETSKITPRADLKQTDFDSIWWVGDRADGGFVAVQLKNALSTAGFSLQTTKNGKGQTALTITGHVSINAQNEMPMVFYSMDPEPTTKTYSITQNLTNVTSSFTGSSVNENDTFSATLTEDENYSLTEEGASVVVTMAGVDVTNTSYVSTTKTINIENVNGNIVVTATAVYTGA